MELFVTIFSLILMFSCFSSRHFSKNGEEILSSKETKTHYLGSSIYDIGRENKKTLESEENRKIAISEIENTCSKGYKITKERINTRILSNDFELPYQEPPILMYQGSLDYECQNED